ncbi:MAG: porin family protein [Flavobacteriaceae bacterium]
MKKNILVVIIVIFTLNINAQNVKFGAKAGLNISSIYGSEAATNNEFRYSFHVGVVSEIKISDKFTFQPEILFSSQGTRMNYEDFIEDQIDVVYEYISVKSVSAMNYLNIPLMIKYYPFNNFSIEFGPQVGFLLSVNNEFELKSGRDTISQSSSNMDGTNRVDFALNLGLGYKLENGIFFNSRYNFGLSAINKEMENQIYFEKARNGVLQLSIGYFFN